MSRQKFATNPESAYYYKHIRRQRALKRMQGYLYLIESVGCFTIVCAFGVLFFPHNLTAIPPILFFLILGIFLLVTGILALKRGHQPVTDEDIASQRSTERKQLFQYAQGAIPSAMGLLLLRLWSSRTGWRCTLSSTHFLLSAW